MWDELSGQAEAFPARECLQPLPNLSCFDSQDFWGTSDGVHKRLVVLDSVVRDSDRSRQSEKWKNASTAWRRIDAPPREPASCGATTAS